MKNIAWMMIIPTENNGVMPENNAVAPLLYCVKSVLAKSKKLPHLFSKSFMSWTSVLAPYKTTKETTTATALLRNSEEQSSPNNPIITASSQFEPISAKVLISNVFDSALTDAEKDETE